MTKCFSYSLYGCSISLSLSTIMILLCFFPFIFVSNEKTFSFFYLILPLISFILDVLYWQTEIFYGVGYFVIFIVLTLSPVIELLWDIFINKKTVPFWSSWKKDHEDTLKELFWFSVGESRTGNDSISIVFQGYLFAEEDDYAVIQDSLVIPFTRIDLFPKNTGTLGNFLHYLCAWILAIAAQVVCAGFYLMMVAINVIIWLFWISIAVMGMKTKILALEAPKNIDGAGKDWYYFW